MNSSAKSTAALSFLAAAALGAVVFMGCTVSSGTSPDTEGDDTSAEDQDSGTSNDDAGTQDDAATGSTCATWTTEFTGQACLDTHCCNEQAACAAIQKSDSVPVSCDEYAECIAKVTADAEANPDAGAPDYSLCDDATDDTVKAAYNAIVQCATDNACAE